MIDFGPTNFRSLKVSSVLKRALSQMFLEEFYDISKVVSVSYVRVSEDLREATVFVVIGDSAGEGKEEIMPTLNDASKLIRRLVFKYVKLRYVPRLYFKLDEGFYHLIEMGDVFAECSKEHE